MWTWRNLKGNAAPVEVKPPAPASAPVVIPMSAVTNYPSAAAGTFGTPFYGCADIHTPHFGVCHTPLQEDEDEADA